MNSRTRGQMPWWDAWLTAITRPHLVYYEALAKNTDITRKRAYSWIFVGGLFGGLMFVISRLIYRPDEVPEPHALALTCGPVAYALLMVILYVILVAFTNATAKYFFIGAGSFMDLSRPIAAFSAPLMVVTSIVALIPFLSFANYGLMVYSIGLAIISVKAVHQIGWGEATVSCIAFVLPTILSLISSAKATF